MRTTIHRRKAFFSDQETVKRRGGVDGDLFWCEPDPRLITYRILLEIECFSRVLRWHLWDSWFRVSSSECCAVPSDHSLWWGFWRQFLVHGSGFCPKVYTSDRRHSPWCCWWCYWSVEQTLAQWMAPRSWINYSHRSVTGEIWRERSFFTERLIRKREEKVFWK